MINVNEFMLMAINRCIDYTKASNGVKLVPRLETINFKDAINLPLNCIKTIQNNKIHINTPNIPHNIATNIITDKQWLQENILCLLSNAVKYSTGGTVNVSIKLETAGITTGSKLVSDVVVTAAPRTGGDVIRISIEDTGIGISDDMVSIHCCRGPFLLL